MKVKPSIDPSDPSDSTASHSPKLEDNSNVKPGGLPLTNLKTLATANLNNAGGGSGKEKELEETFVTHKIGSLSYHILLPGHRFRVWWAVLMTTILIWYCIMIPLTTFFFDANSISNDTTFVIMTIDIIADACSVIDIILRFLIFAVVKDSHRYVTLREIQSHYLSKWFWIDLIATFPGAVILNATRLSLPNVSPWLVLIEFPKVLRMTRISSYIAEFDAFLLTNKIFIAAAAVRITKYIVSFVVVSNLITCFFYYSSYHSPQPNWLSTFTTSDDGIGLIIVKVMYFVYQTLFTVGFGDVPPVNNLENLYMSVICLLGSINCAFIIGSMSSLLTNIDSTRNLYRAAMDDIEMYAVAKELPLALRVSYRKYFEVMWNRNKGRLEEDIISDFPVSLELKLKHEVFHPLLNTHFFKELNVNHPNLYDALINEIMHKSFVKDDTVYRKKFPVPEMWVINIGELHTIADDGESIERLGPGDLRGYEYMIDETRAPQFEIKATQYTDLLVLTKLSILKVLESNKEFSKFLEVLFPHKNSAKYANIITAADSRETQLIEKHKKDRKKNAMHSDSYAHKKHWWYINPNGYRKFVWDSFIMASILYFSIMSTTRAVFPNGIELTVFLDIFLEIMIAIDTFIMRPIEHEIERAIENSDLVLPHKLSKIIFGVQGNFTFLSIGREVCIFFFMFLSVFAALGVFGESNVNLYAWFGAFHTFRLVRMFGKIITLNKQLDNWNIHVGSSFIQLLTLLFEFVISLHLFTCTYILLRPDLNEQSNAITYVTILNYVLYTVSTDGASAPSGMGADSYAYFNFVMVFGTMIFAGSISFIGTLSSKSAGKGTAILSHKEVVTLSYFADRLINPEIGKKVDGFFEYCSARKGLLLEDEILSLKNGVRCNGSQYLPSWIRDQIIAHITIHCLKNSKLFRSVEKEFLFAISQTLCKEFYCAGDMIIVSSQVETRKFLVIENGEAEILGEKNKVLKTIQTGDSYGEVAILSEEKDLNQLRAKTFITVWTMKFHTYQKLLVAFSFYKDSMQGAMQELLSDEKADENLKKNLASKKLQKLQSGGDENEAKKDFRIKSDTKVQHVWNVVVFLCVLYNLFLLPLRLGFYNDSPLNPGITMDYIVDIIYVADIFLRFFLFEYNERDGLVSTSAAIKTAYYKNYLFYDVAASIPVDIFYILIGVGMKLDCKIGIWCICRLNRLVRLNRMSGHLTMFEKNLTAKNETAWRILKLTLNLITMCHIFGCLLSIVPIYFSSGADKKWTDNYAELGVIDFYVVSIYWAFQTIAYIGYGDVAIISTAEISFCVITLLLAGFIYGDILANLDAIIAQADITSVLFQDKLVRIRKYAISKKLDQALLYRIISHMLDVWIHQKGVEENEILCFYPESIRVEIKKQLCDGSLNKVPLIKNFKNIDKVFLALLSEVYLAGEHIFDTGEIASKMFIVSSGVIECYHETTKTVFTTFSKGDFFGESAFLLEDAYDSNTKASVRSCLFVLTRSALEEILKNDPNLSKSFNSEIMIEADKIRKNGSVSKFKKNMQSKKISKLSDEGENKNKGINLIILPDSMFRQIWNVLMMIPILYYCCRIPYLLAYNVENYFSAIGTDPVLILDIVFDLFLYANVVFEALFFARSENGSMMKTHREIFIYFLKNSALYYLLAMLPSQYIFVAVGERPLSYFWFGICELPRMLMFGIFFHLINETISALEQKMIYINSSFRQIFRLEIVVLLSCHILACIRSGVLYSERDPITGNRLLDTSVDSYSLHTQALLWAVYTITTVGFGNQPNPTTNLRILSIVTMVCGAFLCDGGTTACLSKYISTIDEDDSIVKRSKECAFSFITTRKINSRLRALVDKYYENSSGVPDEESSSELIPIHFRPEIVHSIAIARIEFHDVPLLSGFNLGMVRSLTYMLKPDLFMPGDILIRANLAPDRMFFLVKGDVEKQFHRTTIIANHTDDSDSILSNFGVIGGNKLGHIEKYTYKAITFVDTFYFLYTDYQVIVNSISTIGGLYETIQDLLNDNAGIRSLMDFMNESHNSESLKFYMDVKDYRNLVDESASMKKKAIELYDKYVSDDATEQINIRSDVKAQIDALLQFGIKTLFDSASSEVIDMVRKDVIPRFVKSTQFQNLIKFKDMNRRNSKFSSSKSKSKKKGSSDMSEALSSLQTQGLLDDNGNPIVESSGNMGMHTVTKILSWKNKKSTNKASLNKAAVVDTHKNSLKSPKNADSDSDMSVTELSSSNKWNKKEDESEGDSVVLSPHEKSTKNHKFFDEKEEK